MLEIIRVECTGEDGAATLTAQNDAVAFEIKLGQYKGLAAAKKQIAVTADDVEEELAAMAKKAVSFVSTDRPVQEGDTAVIDFEGFLDGVPFEGGKGEGYRLGIGSGTFVPGFEEQLVGMNEGEERDIDITFPENYHEGLAGKAVVFHVKVNSVLQPQIPALDDAFAKSVSGAATLEELRKNLSSQLFQRRADEVQAEFENDIMKELVKNVKANVPDAMVDEQIELLIQEFVQQLASQGVDIEAYYEMAGTTPEQLREVFRYRAQDRVESIVALTAVAAVENFDVTDQEVDAELEQMFQVFRSFQMTEEDVREQVDIEMLRRDLVMRKAYKLVMDEAKVL